MPDLISIGECMIELFSEEPIEEADTFTRSLAGDSFNICVAAQRLDTSSGYITRLGDDPFAAYLLNTWNSLGIDTSQIKTVAGFNAVHFVALMPDGDREFVYYRGGSAPTTLEPGDLDPRLHRIGEGTPLLRHRAGHIGERSRDGSEGGADSERARSQGLLRPKLPASTLEPCGYAGGGFRTAPIR